MSDKKLDLIIDELHKLNGKVDQVQSFVDQMQSHLVQNEQMTTQLIKMVSNNNAKLDDIAIDMKKLSEDYERHDRVLETLSMRSMEQETQIREVRRYK